MKYDVIVAGLGAMGSAAAYHLARRGAAVLGLERFSIPNEMGSSHGETRIIRLAYAEDPRYVPLLRRAFELWRQAEEAAGRRLLYVTGCLHVGRPGDSLIRGVMESCRLHGLHCDALEADEVRRRFPAWRLDGETVGMLDPAGGYLLPEECIRAHAELARAAGAELHPGEPVVAWEPSDSGVSIRTRRGEYSARKLVVTAGAWASSLLPELARLTSPERQVMTWFAPLEPALFTQDRFPVFIADLGGGTHYGFPRHSARGVKVGGHHHQRQQVDPESVDRTVQPGDIEVTRSFVRSHLPGADGELVDARVCLYTNSPDENFLIDVHPQLTDVVIAAGFSGHGFKFASVVGEILAQLALEGDTPHDISFLRLQRFQALETTKARTLK